MFIERIHLLRKDWKGRIFFYKQFSINIRIHLGHRNRFLTRNSYFFQVFFLWLHYYLSVSKKIVCSRFGPTEAIVTGIPISSSIKSM